MEILAPVGEINMLYAAVRAGANAVYLGLEQMNARKSAANFTPYALKEAVAYCHARKVKVFVTLNTLMQGTELLQLPLVIKQIAESGADAVIVQDLATAVLIKKIAPGLKLHASTQMSVHSVHGALLLKDMGFTRVILSRELPLDTIAEISSSCGIETEIFVHGALCMCVSGQCYMSAFFGGRSGNKGSCAGPCRLPFSANGNDTAAQEEIAIGNKKSIAHHLSLKDMSCVHMLKDIEKAGVTCVKIEGRLRTPEYTAAAINACLCELYGKEYDKQLLQDVFSRSGFTSGYLEGKLGGEMFGVRTSEDSEAQKRALPRLRELFRTERQSVKVTMQYRANGGGAELRLLDEDGFFVREVLNEKPMPAQKDRSEDIKKSLSKTGGTPFYVGDGKYDIEIEGAHLFLPSSSVNSLRKNALEKLLSARSNLKPHEVDESVFESAQKSLSAQVGTKNTKTAQKQLFVQVYDIAQLPDEWLCDEDNAGTAGFALSETDAMQSEHEKAQADSSNANSKHSEAPSGFIVPLSQWQSVPYSIRKKTWLALPEFCGLTSVEQRTENIIKQVFAPHCEGEKFAQNENCFAGCFVQNAAHIHMCKGINMFGGFRLNAVNSLSFTAYGAMGISTITAGIEATCDDILSMKPSEQTANLVHSALHGTNCTADEFLSDGTAKKAFEKANESYNAATSAASSSYANNTAASTIIIGNKFTSGSHVATKENNNIFWDKESDKAFFENETKRFNSLYLSQNTAKLAAVVYGHMPLMLTYACPLHNVRTCKGCSGRGVLTDRKGEKLNVTCTAPGNGGARLIHNAVPLYMGDKQHTIDADVLIAMFTTETKSTVRDITAKISRGDVFDGRYTRGLYFK